MKTESPQQKWNKANKAKQAAYNKEYNKKYRLANKEKVAAWHKERRESQKDGLFTVYLLPKENYVGQTDYLTGRLQAHRAQNNRDTTGVWIIGKYETRAEALAIEAEYHANGFNGYYRGI